MKVCVILALMIFSYFFSALTSFFKCLKGGRADGPPF